MDMTAHFDYDRFASLQALELTDYVEPLLLQPSLRIPGEIIERMFHDVSHYDEYHLVYALLLGAVQSPNTFVPIVPQYLTHDHLSVRCTAHNILDRLPDDYVTQSLVDSVRSVLSFHPTDEFVAGILEKLEPRLGGRRDLV